MNNSTEPKFSSKELNLIASLWVEATIVIILCTSLASLVSQFIWGARMGLVVAILWAIYRCKKEVFKPKLLSYRHGGWMLWTIIIGCFISLIVQPHCFLDSYSYRIPQMLFWIQEGHPWSVPNVDMRINQMPHVWPMLSASFYSFFGEKGIALPNFISLLLFIWLLKDTARNAGIKDQLVNYVVTIFIAAPVVVMGASTNDNVITCTTFLFLSYFFACRTETTPKNISLSAISFALACGIKPQYLTLAPLWIGWFFLYEGKPYKQLKLTHYLYLIPLVIICSPIPTMTINEFVYGSFNRPYVIDETTTVSTGEKVASSGSFIGSLVKLIKSHLDIPINPFYNQINNFLTSLNLQQFSFKPLIIPEWGGMGLVTFIAFCLGIFKKKTGEKHFFVIAIYSFFALLVAIYMTKAGSIGRSFIGFFWLMLPFVFCAYSNISHKFIKGTTFIAFLFSLGYIILDPSGPLWPARTIAKKINHPKIKNQILDYSHYSKRQYAIAEIMDSIPNDIEKIGIIIISDRPIAELWLNKKSIKNVIPLGSNVPSEFLQKNDIQYLIVMNPVLNKENRDKFLTQIDAEIILEAKYITHIQRGPEPWFLCKVKE